MLSYLELKTVSRYLTNRLKQKSAATLTWSITIIFILNYRNFKGIFASRYPQGFKKQNNKKPSIRDLPYLLSAK
jgi:hypothetical protein